MAKYGYEIKKAAVMGYLKREGRRAYIASKNGANNIAIIRKV